MSSTSNPSRSSEVAFRNSKGGKGVFVPKNSLEIRLGGGEKTSHPTPIPETNSTTATTATIATDTPLAPRIASAGGAAPPSAMPVGIACQYLNFASRQERDLGSRATVTRRPF